MNTDNSKLIAGWSDLKELTALIGSEAEATRLLIRWSFLNGQFAGESDNFFTGANRAADADQLKKMRSAANHISALIPLLDLRMAWLLAIQTPGFHEGPEVASKAEEWLKELARTLESLRSDIERAALAIKPKKGRSFQMTPQGFLLVSLITSLEELGVPFSSAENSKMVRAVRLLWSAAEWDGDPRDRIRSLSAANPGA